MYMETVFKRVVAGGVAWTLDTLPEDSAGNQVPPGQQAGGGSGATDNAIAVRCFDTNGYPPTRLMVSYAGPTGAVATTAKLYVFDRNTKQYYVTPDSASGKTLTLGQLTYFSIPVQADPAQNSNNSQGAPNTPGIARAVDLVLIVTNTPTTNGTYYFGMAPGYGSAAQP